MARTTWPEETSYYRSATRRVSSSKCRSWVVFNNNNHSYYRRHHGQSQLLTNLGIWHKTRYICIFRVRVSVTIRIWLSNCLTTYGMRNNLQRGGSRGSCRYLQRTYRCQRTHSFVYPHALAMLIVISVADKWSGQNHLYFYGETRFRADHHQDGAPEGRGRASISPRVRPYLLQWISGETLRGA